MARERLRLMEIRLENRIVEDVVIRLTSEEVKPLIRMKVITQSNEPMDYSRVSIDVDGVSDFYAVGNFLEDLQKFLIENVKVDDSV